MTSNILSGIANPTLADPFGSFEEGAQVGRDEETRRLVGEILGSTTAGKLGALGKVNAPFAIKLAGQLKFDDDPEKQIKEFVGTVQLATAVGNSVGPKESLAILVESRNRLKGLVDQGLLGAGATATLDGMIQTFNDNPKQGIEALNLMNDALVEQGLAKSPATEQKFSAKTDILEDGTTIQTTSRGKVIVRDPAGNKVTGEDAAAAVAAANEEGVRLQSARAGGRAGASAEEKRAFSLIDRGTLAAESTAVIRRALTLLDTIDTGGIAAVSLEIKKTLGIEGADEGELSNSLGKAVLSQLRETFGAQFTESEGKRLERIEAGFSKSPANNRRLLTQTLRIAERIAGRARRVADKRGLADAVKDIDDLLSFSLNLEEPKQSTDISTGNLQQLTSEQRKARIAELRAKQ